MLWIFWGSVDDDAQEGEYYLVSSNRYGPVDNPRQYITEKITYYGKGSYRVSAYIKLLGQQESGTAQIVVQTVSSDKSFGSKEYPGQIWFSTDPMSVNSTSWSKIEGDPGKRYPLVPWEDSLAAGFKKKFGYDLMTYLPALFGGNNEMDKQVRQHYCNRWNI